jgi:hypothetical protein
METLLSIIQKNQRRYTSVYQTFGVCPEVLVVKRKGVVVDCNLEDLKFEVDNYRIYPTVRGFKLFSGEYSVEYK